MKAGVGLRQLPSKNWVVYSVKSIKEINNVIIPHFDNYPLLTQKRAPAARLRARPASFFQDRYPS
jgi:hypothetical protein